MLQSSTSLRFVREKRRGGGRTPLYITKTLKNSASFPDSKDDHVDELREVVEQDYEGERIDEEGKDDEDDAGADEDYLPAFEFDSNDEETAMFAALYVLAPNGRVGGIEDLRDRQYEQLHSIKFKTNTRYGYQPAILSTIPYFNVKTYWDHIEVHAEGSGNSNAS